MDYAEDSLCQLTRLEQKMSLRPETLKQSELLHQLVLDRSTMEELGRVEVLWMYPEAHRVLGFVCKTGLLGQRKLAFKLGQLDAFGGNGVLTQGQPEETDADRVRQLESLVQTDVWTDSGERVGKIIDCIFKLPTGYITDYLLVTDGLVGITSNIYRLPPHQILSLGRKRVLVADTTPATLSIYRESVRQKLSKTGEFLKDDVTQELKALVEQAQSVTHQARDRWFALREQVKEQAQQLSQQTKGTLQSLNQPMQELTQDWLDSQVEQSPPSGSPWRLQALKSAEADDMTTVSVEAEEIADGPEPMAAPAPPQTLPASGAIGHSDPLLEQEQDWEADQEWDVDDDEFWLDVVPPEALKSPPSPVSPDQSVIKFDQPQPAVEASPANPDEEDAPWI